MKVLVIDSDPNTIETINLTFELGWQETKVITAQTKDIGIKLLENEQPNGVILELNLADCSGFDALKEIRLFSEVPVLVLSTRKTEQDVVKAFAWGANDYLTKPFHQMELLARVKAMTRSVNITDQEMRLCYGSWHFGRSLTELYNGLQKYDLTPVEGLIMHTLMKYSGQFVDSDMLISKVWGLSHQNAADSLRVHVCHLRKKLGDDHVHPHIIVNQPGRGYTLAEPRENARSPVSAFRCVTTTG